MASYTGYLLAGNYLDGELEEGAKKFLVSLCLWGFIVVARNHKGNDSLNKERDEFPKNECFLYVAFPPIHAPPV